jgi:hypothetical protein
MNAKRKKDTKIATAIISERSAAALFLYKKLSRSDTDFPMHYALCTIPTKYARSAPIKSLMSYVYPSYVFGTNDAPSRASLFPLSSFRFPHASCPFFLFPNIPNFGIIDRNV